MARASFGLAAAPSFSARKRRKHSVYNFGSLRLFVLNTLPASPPARRVDAMEAIKGEARTRDDLQMIV
eukprot:855206-Pyramimonas_sp.AAC.1